MGDYYWKDNPDIDLAVKESVTLLPPGTFKNEVDIEKFVNSTISTEIPLSKPQWEIYMQENYLEN